MQWNARKLLGGLSKCALLLLSILVIGWGLGAKLDLYHAGKHQLPTTDSTAKLSAETRSTPVPLSAPQRSRPRVTSDSVILASVYFHLPEARFSASVIRQMRDRRVDEQQNHIYGQNCMRRPPPVLS